MDTTDFRYKGKVTVEGYIDTYYAYDFNEPQDSNRPYSVSMNRHNELTINLAFIDLKYSSSRLRARLVPGFGTYVNANYSREPGSIKNIIEASAGIKISKNKNIWVDAGMFGSPYTNESAISKDHLAYTRSFAPEFVPYYLAGIKFSMPLSEKVNMYLYALNGWQQVADQNSGKSIGTQLEFRPTDYFLVNWNMYAGQDRVASDSTNGNRFFTDLFFLFSKGKWSATGCVYGGIQEHESERYRWGQANLIGRYAISEIVSLTGRIEYFSDGQGVQVVPITNVKGFSCYSSSIGINLKFAENILIRFEGRTFFSEKNVFERDNQAVNNSNLFTSNITIWF
jgi:hypothetical protein